MAVFWYGLVPIAGALVKRLKWRQFRIRFDELRLCPVLNYGNYRQQDGNGAGGKTPAVFRFAGNFESVTDGQTLWIRGEDLTVPVSLKNAETYLLPMQKKEGAAEMFDPGDEAPEKIRWERVSALTEGVRVFVGGLLAYQDGRCGFISPKEKPLTVILYDGPDQSLAEMVVRAGRLRGDYWNSVTPYSLIFGALCQILMAVLFISRPAFRLTVIVAFIALFIPLYPMIPPGLLFTVIYRRLTWMARTLLINGGLTRLPLCYLASQGNGNRRGKKAPLNDSCLLPDGELYGFIRIAELPPQAHEGKIPLLLPKQSKPGGPWLVFGALVPGEDLPSRPADPFATFGILPDGVQVIARHNTIMAYTLETLAWLTLLAGIGLNIFFLRMVSVLL